MVIDMERDIKDILTEVLVFPYEQSVVDAITQACSSYVKAVEIGQFEDCVLHLCMDIPAAGLIEHVDTQTGCKFPSRVYRALAGYVVGETLDNVSDEDDNVVFSLALRNAMKAKTDDADGIISKTIDPASFAAVENYWAENIVIPSLCGKDIVSSTIFENSSWVETGLDIDDAFGDIQTLAKFYSREQFKKKLVGRKPTDNQDVYDFANQMADEIAAKDWLFIVEKPVEIFKGLELKGTAISLSNIKLRVRGNDSTVNNDIESISVFRRYLYADDYVELGSIRINPLNFAIAIFYELLYERLKSEKYE